MIDIFVNKNYHKYEGKIKTSWKTHKLYFPLVKTMTN